MSFVTEIYLALLVCATMTPVEVGALTTCSCYTYFKQGFRWQGCRDECQKSGGDLVSMETEEEWEFIKKEIQNKSTQASWNEWYIGLYRNQTNANWTWVSGKPLTIRHWQPRKPDNENFALIAKNYPAGTFGLFNSITGRSYKAYICEETRTNNCLDCWVHPTTPPKTVEVTSSSKPSEPHTTPVSPTEKGTTSFPEKGSSTPNVDGKKPLVLILAVVLGVLFAVALVLLGIFLFRRYHRRRKTPASKVAFTENTFTSAGGKKQRPQLSHNYQGSDEVKYDTVHEAAKLLQAPREDETQTYAEISTGNDTYATVDKSKKTQKKENSGELCYAELGEFDNNTGSAEPEKPAPYTPTVYADVVGTVTGLKNKPAGPEKSGEVVYANMA